MFLARGVVEEYKIAKNKVIMQPKRTPLGVITRFAIVSVSMTINWMLVQILGHCDKGEG